MLINNPVDTEYAELSTQAICIFKEGEVSTQAICIFKEGEVYDLISRIAAISRRSNSAAAPQSSER